MCGTSLITENLILFSDLDWSGVVLGDWEGNLILFLIV